MVKRVLNYVKKEFVAALRNNMVIYTTLLPVVLAICLSLFLPGMQSMKLTVAAEKSVDQNVLDGLKRYANVEVFENREKVVERVERPDDLAGIVKEGDQYIVILEGNESGEAEGIASALMNFILTDKPKATYEHVSLGKQSSPIKEISGSLLLLTALIVGGFVVGMGIVDEKESKSIKALAVSPIRMYEYVASHTILCLISGIVLALLSSLILAGTSISYFNIIIAMVATTGIAVIVGYLIGALSDNLISAIAVIKFIMLVFLAVPIGSLFVPQNYQWVFYIFPHYWAFQAYQSIFKNGDHFVSFELASLIAFGFSIVLLVVLTPMIKKRLQLR